MFAASLMHIIIIYSAALFNHSLAEFYRKYEKKWRDFAKKSHHFHQSGYYRHQSLLCALFKNFSFVMMNRS